MFGPYASRLVVAGSSIIFASSASCSGEGPHCVRAAASPSSAKGVQYEELPEPILKLRSPHGCLMTIQPGSSLPVAAVVVTHQRPRLATDVVRNLLEVEGLPPDRVVLVVNGEAGLDDPTLQAAVQVVSLPENVGPAGGFREGMIVAGAIPGAEWLYLCEDDVLLFDLPSPRLERLVRDAELLRR